MFDVCMPWLMLPVIGLCRMAKVNTRVNFAKSMHTHMANECKTCLLQPPISQCLFDDRRMQKMRFFG